MKTNFSTLAARYNGAFSFSRLVSLSFDSLTTEEDAKQVEAFFEGKECVFRSTDSDSSANNECTALLPLYNRSNKVSTLFAAKPAGSAAMRTMSSSGSRSTAISSRKAERRRRRSV